MNPISRWFSIDPIGRPVLVISTLMTGYILFKLFYRQTRWEVSSATKKLIAVWKIAMAAIAVLGVVGWGSLILFAMAMAASGDGAGPGKTTLAEMFLVLVPFVYFLFCFLGCFRFVWGKTLIYGGIAIHLLILPDVAFLLKGSLADYTALATIYMSFWFLMVLVRVRTEPERGDSSLRS